MIETNHQQITIVLIFFSPHVHLLRYFLQEQCVFDFFELVFLIHKKWNNKRVLHRSQTRGLDDEARARVWSGGVHSGTCGFSYRTFYCSTMFLPRSSAHCIKTTLSPGARTGGGCLRKHTHIR